MPKQIEKIRSGSLRANITLGAIGWLIVFAVLLIFKLELFTSLLTAFIINTVVLFFLEGYRQYPKLKVDSRIGLLFAASFLLLQVFGSSIITSIVQVLCLLVMFYFLGRTIAQKQFKRELHHKN
ncbi:MAG: hypothetical protein JXQ87_18215 [Bacteroidia bacterium]